jgi:hypothetical protein
MQERGKKSWAAVSSVPGGAKRRRHVLIPLGVRERNIVFSEMILAELKLGRLTRAKRRQLLRYATKMGVSTGEAGLMIDTALHLRSSGSARPGKASATHGRVDATSRGALREIVIVSGVCLLLNVLIFCAIF